MFPRFKSLVVAAAAVAASASVAMAAGSGVSPLVDTDWLKANLGNDNVVILDIRSLKDTDDAKGYLSGHVPTALSAPYPGDWRSEKDGVREQLPTVPDIEAYLSNIGVDESKTVIVVPNGKTSSEFSAGARVYWTLKELGHDQVAILDGGTRAWTDAGLELEAKNVAPAPTIFEAKPRPELIASTEDVASQIGTSTVLLDARPQKFFVGETKHKFSARPGRLPGSLDLDQDAFFDKATGKLKPKAELAMIAAATLGDKTARIVSYCNTGHWAAANWFVLHELLGYENVALYDASMVGWTQDPNRPVETGAPKS